MSDSVIRDLERAAAAGDANAAERLPKERCRRGLHEFPDGLVMWRHPVPDPSRRLTIEEAMREVETYQVCRHCGTAAGLPPATTVVMRPVERWEDEVRDLARARLRVEIDRNPGPVVHELQRTGWAEMAPVRQVVPAILRTGSTPANPREVFHVRLVEFACRCGSRMGTVHIEGEPAPVAPAHTCTRHEV